MGSYQAYYLIQSVHPIEQSVQTVVYNQLIYSKFDLELKVESWWRPQKNVSFNLDI